MKYYLKYVESCTPKIKEFSTKEKLYKFAAEFATSIYNNPDNWIDMAFKGDIFLKGDNFKLD